MNNLITKAIDSFVDDRREAKNMNRQINIDYSCQNFLRAVDPANWKHYMKEYMHKTVREEWKYGTNN